MAALLILFLLTACGGAAFAVLEARDRVPPLRFTAGHGLLGIVAIVLLIDYDVNHPGHYFANVAAVIFILTGLGGLLLFTFRATRQKLPLAVVLLHGAFALTAVGLLAVAVYRA